MDAFVSRFNKTPETEWLESVVESLTRLSTDPALTRPVPSSNFRYNGRIDSVTSNTELNPYDLVAKLTSAVCQTLPDALSLEWETQVIQAPDSSALWRRAAIVHKRMISLSKDPAARALPDWLDADMRTRIDRLVDAVGDVARADCVSIPAMEQEYRQFEEDLRSSELLTGEDPVGERTLADLRAKLEQAWDQLRDMRVTVASAIAAYSNEVAECKNLDQAYLAAGRVAAFESEAAFPIDLDPSAISEDMQQSRVRAIKLRGAAEQVQGQSTAPAADQGPRRIAGHSHGM